MGQVAEIAGRFLRDVVRVEAVLLLPGSNGELRFADDGGDDRSRWIEPRTALTAYEGGACAGLDVRQAVGYFPLKAPTRVRGVMAVTPLCEGGPSLYEHHELLETVASLVAIAIERLHYVEVANSAQLQMVSERLRSSILSAVSHDLRTPLTALVGLADSLTLCRPPLPAQSRENAEAIRDQAVRLSGLVSNVLDMARLSAGDVKLRKEWQPLQEVIGSSIKLLGKSLADPPVSVRLPARLPLLEFDAVLIERVFCNLLENAVKYTPPGSPIEISAQCRNAVVEVAVCDQGPGIPAGRGSDIFEMFVRGAQESSTPGVGLGLAICRAIVEAHAGSISASNRLEGGACFTFTLPKGSPPMVEVEELAPGIRHE